ncbi:hypothetical protein BT69DRAFT_1315540 [Atractiella rhizophila]|nr:hypothetical protein BT69DRAFT_1315540 [Atractiella rhizophila]
MLSSNDTEGKSNAPELDERLIGRNWESMLEMSDSRSRRRSTPPTDPQPPPKRRKPNRLLQLAKQATNEQANAIINRSRSVTSDDEEEEDELGSDEEYRQSSSAQSSFEEEEDRGSGSKTNSKSKRKAKRKGKEKRARNRNKRVVESSEEEEEEPFRYPNPDVITRKKLFEYQHPVDTVVRDFALLGFANVAERDAYIESQKEQINWDDFLTEDENEVEAVVRHCARTKQMRMKTCWQPRAKARQYYLFYVYSSQEAAGVSTANQSRLSAMDVLDEDEKIDELKPETPQYLDSTVNDEEIEEMDQDGFGNLVPLRIPPSTPVEQDAQMHILMLLSDPVFPPKNICDFVFAPLDTHTTSARSGLTTFSVQQLCPCFWRRHPRQPLVLLRCGNARTTRDVCDALIRQKTILGIKQLKRGYWHLDGVEILPNGEAYDWNHWNRDSNVLPKMEGDDLKELKPQRVPNTERANYKNKYSTPVSLFYLAV